MNKLNETILNGLNHKPSSVKSQQMQDRGAALWRHITRSK